MFAFNPELQRNLWIECGPLRLAAATLGPLLVFALVASQRDPANAVFHAAHVMILVATAFWGARKAADAVAGEIRERTWDQQRLSGLDPASVTLGKVFGAPSAVWMLILVCVAAQLVALSVGAGGGARATQPLGVTLFFGFPVGVAAVFTQILGALTVFAVAFFTGLLALSGQDRPRAFDATLFQLFGVGAGLSVLSLVAGASVARDAAMGAPKSAIWWGLPAPLELTLPLAYAAFGAWALYGGVHQMRRAFAMRTHALAWIGFLLFLAAFVAGFAPERWALVAALTLAMAAYAAAVFEPHPLAEYRAWLRRLTTRPGEALITAPAWMYAWLLALPTAALALARGDLAPPEWAEVVVDYAPEPALLAAALFVLRDMLICVWAGLRARDGRGLWAAALILAVLHVLMGPLTSPALFAPLSAASVVSALFQTIVMGVLVAREIAQPVRGPDAAMEGAMRNKGA